MILDQIRNHAFYAQGSRLGKVLSYMATVTPETFPEATVELERSDAFVNPVCFTTKPEKECLFEAHRRYADVHFIVEGCEKIIVQDIGAVQLHTPYIDKKDIGFYTCDEGTICVLYPGDFLVCYPQDAHKVAIAPGSPAPVKKLVGKIRI